MARNVQSRGRGASSAQGRRMSQLDPWSETVLIRKYQGSTSRRSVCTHCGKVLTGGVTRVKAHLTWTSRKGTDLCLAVPEDVWLAYGGDQDRYTTLMGQLVAPITAARLEEIVHDERARLATETGDAPNVRASTSAPPPHSNSTSTSDMESSQPCAATSESTGVGTSATALVACVSGTRDGRHEAPEPFTAPSSRALTSRKRVQGGSNTLHEVWAPSLKKRAKIAEERFFYQCNIAFNVARTGAYKRFVTAISAAAAARSPITPANPEALRTTRLTRQVDMVSDQLADHRESWAVYGCTIISHGWKDVRKCNLLNVLVSCCTGTTFLRSIDVSGHGVCISGEIIFRYIEEAIEKVGPKHVVQVITDIATNCKLMGELVETKYPHIVWTPCAAHSIDLMMEDIGELPWIAEVVEKALQFINFITRKSFALGLLKHHCKWVLKKPAKTRFCFIFIVLCRLVKCKDDLQRMVTDQEWLDWAESTSSAALTIQDTINNNSFWADADAIQAALSPIVSVLRLCESEGSTMGLLYEFMVRLRHAIRDCNILSPERVAALLEIFERRWSWFQRPIHCVAHMLHPLWRSDAHKSDRVLISGWNAYVERVYHNNGQLQNQLEEDLLEYRGNRGSFSRLIAKDPKNQAAPVSWWEKFGGFTPTLQALAMRVLSQEVSSSSAGRFWSIMGDKHTKDRNRLNNAQLDQLAYVNANLRVLEKAGALVDAGPMNWNVKQIDHTKVVIEAADISKFQLHVVEEDAYDFIHEDLMRSTRQTRSSACQRRGETSTRASRRTSTTRGHGARSHGRGRPRASKSGRLTPTPSECESDSESSGSGDFTDL